MYKPLRITFDLGGTWFRSAVVTETGVLAEIKLIPGVNYERYQESIEELENRILRYLLQQTDEYLNHREGEEVELYVSFGAAVNHRTSVILGSGPVFGPTPTRFDIVKKFEEIRPGYRIVVVNDITALLIGFVSENTCCRELRKVAAITVSSGIGARTVDMRDGRIAIDDSNGLQGEIGHVPIEFTAFGAPVKADCDCGGKDHLNAFCSGRGIERLAGTLDEVRQFVPRPWQGGAGLYESWRSGLEAKRWECRAFLEDVVRPVSRCILMMLTLDPELDMLVLTGGVIAGLAPFYGQTLLRLAAEEGPYLQPNPTQFLSDRIRFISEDPDICMRGAFLSSLLAKSRFSPELAPK